MKMQSITLYRCGVVEVTDVLILMAVLYSLYVVLWKLLYNFVLYTFYMLFGCIT